MVYGYSRAQVNEFGLLELREITFALTPEKLRLVARFLEQAAAEMCAGAFATCSHRHLSTDHAEWNEDFDVIVTEP